MSGPVELVVIGGGEHARVVIDAARSRPDAWRLLGFTDPKPCEETARRTGTPWLGDDQRCLATVGPNARFVLGVGAIGVASRRQEVVARLAALGVRWATVLHRAACVSDTATVGEGVTVFAGAIVNTGARLGNHCVVNTGAIIEHDVAIGSFAMVGPGAAVGGGAQIGDESYLGLGCRIRDHVEVGRRVLVGMGAVVVRSALDGAVLVGVPARARGEGA